MGYVGATGNRTLYGLRLMLTVVLLMLLATGTQVRGVVQEAAAQDGETVTLTVELTIDGEVPEGHYFGLDYPVGRQGERVPDDVPLCTTAPRDVGPGNPMCEAGGTYTASVEVSASHPVSFDIIRYTAPGEPPERFFQATREFDEDTTISTTYTVPPNLRPAETRSETGGDSRPTGGTEGQTDGERFGGSSAESGAETGTALALSIAGVTLLITALGILIYRSLR